MPTINQIRANRENAKKSTGPKTPEGKDRVRFNALVHGLRAESAVLPEEDHDQYHRHLERAIAAWDPQDDVEKDMVEQIAVNQWKLARLDRNEARIYDPAVPHAEFALAIHRVYLTQTRLERSISATMADLERRRKIRLEREEKQNQQEPDTQFKMGLLWSDPEGESHFSVLPRVCGLDGVWREIPREVLGDFPTPDSPPE